MVHNKPFSLQRLYYWSVNNWFKTLHTIQTYLEAWATTKKTPLLSEGYNGAFTFNAAAYNDKLYRYKLEFSFYWFWRQYFYEDNNASYIT
jgi:hypothetical protein